MGGGPFEGHGTQGSPMGSGGGGGGCPRTLDELLHMGGGVVKSELTAKGSLPFSHWGGRKFYVAKKTNTLWDVSIPPPGSCNVCGGLHWFWSCQVNAYKGAHNWKGVGF